MKQAIIIFFLLFSCVSLSAQDVVRVDSVVVTARRSHEIVPAQVLGGERLRRLETHSVADAVRWFSGVQIKDYGGIGGLKTINVRSLGSMHTGVFYDGLAVGNAQNGVVDLGRFSLENVESVSLYNGQRSGIFQSARDFASAAAVYIHTRRPTENRFRARLSGGSFDLVDGSVLWERRLGERLAVSANIQALNTSGRYKYHYSRPGGGWDTTAMRRNGDVFFVRAEAGLFGRLGRDDRGAGGGEWRLKSYYYDSNRGLPGAVIKEDYAISLRNEERQRDRNFFLQGSVSQQISHLYSYRLQAKYAYDYTNYVMPPSTTAQPMDAHYRSSEVYVSVANLFAPTNWLSANLSLDGQYNTLKADASAIFNRNFPEPQRLTLLGAGAISVKLNGFSAQASLLYTYAHDTSAKDRPMAKDRNIFTPTLVLAYRPEERIDLEIRAFYKEIFRLPTFNDLYYTDVRSRSLRPEYTTQYNLGATWRKTWRRGFLASMGVSLDTYYNKVRDKIVATPTSNQLFWTMTNIGRVEILGADLALTQQFRFGSRTRGASVDTRLTYTFQDTSHGDPVPYAPKHSGSAMVNVEFRRWSLMYMWLYTGERYPLGTQKPSTLIEPWYTSDLSLSRDLDLRGASLRVGLEVNNIFDQRYEVVKWYPMPGTNFKLTISISL